MRKDNTAVVPKANTSKYGLKSFVHDGPRIWNSLPNEMRKIVINPRYHTRNNHAIKESEESPNNAEVRPRQTDHTPRQAG